MYSTCVDDATVCNVACFFEFISVYWKSFMFMASVLKHFFVYTLDVTEDISGIIIRFKINRKDECCCGFSLNRTTGKCESKS